MTEYADLYKNLPNVMLHMGGRRHTTGSLHLITNTCFRFGGKRIVRLTNLSTTSQEFINVLQIDLKPIFSYQQMMQASESKGECTNSVEECPADTAKAGRASVCEGCPGQAFCQTLGGTDPDQAAIDLRMGAIKHKVLVLSGKGGVGKSTVAGLLSQALCHQGDKVGLVDLDICGPSVPKLMAVEGQSIINTQYGWKPLVSASGVKVMSVGSMLSSDSSSVVFRGPRKTGLIKRFLKDTFWGRLDYLICDTPPGTSDEHLTIIKILKNVKPDGAIIVTTPQDVALATIRKEINFCRKMNLKILGLLGNMESFVCPCCEECSQLFPGNGLDKLAAEFDIPVIGHLPQDQRITTCCERGMDAFTEYENSPVVRSMKDVSQKVKNMVEQ